MHQEDNVTDHAGGARDSTTCEDLAAASRASDCYDFPLPTGDDAPCHVADGCPAGGCSFLRRHHDTRWPRPGPVADVIHPDVGRRIEPFSPWPAAIQLALLPDRLPRFIQTPVDAAYGCFGSSSPSRLTFDTRPVRPAAMPPFVALREDVRFRPRRRAFDFPRGDRVWIVTIGMTERRRKDGPLERGLPPLRSIRWFVDRVRRPTVRGWTTAAQPIDPHRTTPRERRQTFFAVHVGSRCRGKFSLASGDELLGMEATHEFFCDSWDCDSGTIWSKPTTMTTEQFRPPGSFFSKREPPFKRQTACTSEKSSDEGLR